MGEPTQTIKYEYDSVWKDKLISYNGTQIDYDAFGNPLKYTATSFNDQAINMDLEWNGRLLTSATAVDGSERYEYSYDAAGLRTEKTVFKGQTVSKEVIDESGNKTTVDEHIFLPQTKFEYIWSNDMPAGYKITLYESSTDENGNQTAQTNEKSSFIVNVMYNENGEALGVNCHSELEGEKNSLTFLFVKDAQGNIVSISACEGEYFFNFVYDAFGNVKMDITGEAIDKIQETINSMDSEIEKLLYSLASGLGLAVVTGITFACVPNAYRGYIYDMETGLYYCQSRYYSPEWGRFINADDTSLLELTTGNIHGANLFAYCNNDPVNHTDPSGYWARAVIAGISGTVFGGIAYAIGRAFGISGWKLAAFTSAFVAAGITIGAIWGPKILYKINSLIKPVIYFFSNPGKVYLGVKLLSKVQFELHNPHHGKSVHFVMRMLQGGRWKQIFEWVLKK